MMADLAGIDGSIFGDFDVRLFWVLEVFIQVLI